MSEIKFEIVKNIAVLSSKPSGWNKELNIVSWNGRDGKYVIREWNEDHTRMGKGITLSEEEILNLKTALGNIE